MGRQAQVQARLPEGDDFGRLQFEAPSLIWRGRERRVWSTEALEGLRAEGEDLVLADGARFRLGATQAARWAQAILHPPRRLEKLGAKPGLRIALVGVQDPAFLAELAEVVPEFVPAEGAFDLVFLAAETLEDLAPIPDMATGLSAGDGIWVIFRKGRTSPVSDADVRAAGRAAGLVDTKVCGFSDTHTALKFSRRRA
mgnify:CR=1 FL=1